MSAKHSSSPRRAAKARSPFPPTWPAAEPTFCWAAIPSSWPRNACARRIKIRITCRPAPWARRTPEWDEVYGRFKDEIDRGARRSGRAGRPAHRRHGAPRSRRIDNQLRGRAGRQGDPGSARFYLSLQDDLMRIFGGQRMQNLMLRLGMEEDVPIESKMITQAHRGRAEGRRGAELRRPANTSSNTTT